MMTIMDNLKIVNDEFAAFAIINQDSHPDKIKELIIDDTVEIEQVLTKADAELYIEKKEKKKRICVYKSGFTRTGE